MTRALVSIALAFTACASAPETSAPQSLAQSSDPTLVASTERFALHSHPWLNLHHFLYQWARSEATRAADDRRPVVEPSERAAFEGFTALEQEQWRAAVDYYAEHVVARYLTFNLKLIMLKLELAAAGAVLPDVLPYDVGEALNAAMPIYARYFWAAHDEHNREWANSVVPKLLRHERFATDGLARALGSAWPEPPSAPMRIDASFYANWAGAYTTQDPDHIVISTLDDGNQDWSAFETIVHESGHSGVLASNFKRLIREAFEAEGVEAPDRLWHALHFYVVGELAREVTRTEGVEGFRTYAEVAGFWTSGAWAGYDAIFDAVWQPFMHGDVTQVQALRAMARALNE